MYITLTAPEGQSICLPDLGPQMPWKVAEPLELQRLPPTCPPSVQDGWAGTRFTTPTIAIRFSLGSGEWVRFPGDEP
jgi:hypothetical protein